MTATRTAFSADVAMHIYGLVRERMHLPPADARLIRIGENALIHSHPYVVRIARSAGSLDDARKEVAVSAWLNASGLPASRTSDHEQPVMVDGHPVTVWHFAQSIGRKATAAELGAVLARLHGLPAVGRPDLPRFDIFGRVQQRLDHPAAPSDAVEYLSAEVARLRTAHASLTYPSPPTAIHGDAHVQNIIVTANGPLLIDFERFGIGHPEDDLAVTATERTVGWHTDADYAEFCQAYGADVTRWSGFHVLRNINQLKMTSWLMQNVSNAPELLNEFNTRLTTLRAQGRICRPWVPF